MLSFQGKYVVQCLEGKLSDEHREAWKWRPELAKTTPDNQKHRLDLKDDELNGWH
jgi:hypothetical protein